MYIGEFQNCEIYKYEMEKTVYQVVHKIGGQILHAVCVSEAYKIAKLLDLDYILCSIYCKEEKNNEKY